MYRNDEKRWNIKHEAHKIENANDLVHGYKNHNQNYTKNLRFYKIKESLRSRAAEKLKTPQSLQVAIPTQPAVRQVRHFARIRSPTQILRRRDLEALAAPD